MYNQIKKIIINILKNLIRVGKISSINYDNGTVRVVFPDKDNIVTDELPYLSFEYYMPYIGDTVLCLFLGNGISRGFCLGKFYNNNNAPRCPGEGIYYKHFFDKGYIKYNKKEKLLTIYGDIKVIVEAKKIFLGANATEAISHGTSLKDYLDNHKHPISWTDPSGSGVSGSPTSASPSPSTKVYTE